MRGTSYGLAVAGELGVRRIDAFGHVDIVVSPIQNYMRCGVSKAITTSVANKVMYPAPCVSAGVVVNRSLFMYY